MSITFFDTEIDARTGKILDIGGVRSDGNTFHSNSINDFKQFLEASDFICGHNVLNHDIVYIQKATSKEFIDCFKVVDTLYLSPLLFPTRPYHRLLKDDKLQTEELNNPLNDAKKAKELFYDEVATFHELDGSLKMIFYSLLRNKKEFKAFFEYIAYRDDHIVTRDLIQQCFQPRICTNAPLDSLIADNPVELAYCLSLINSTDRYSITPPWVLMNFPEVERIIYLLRNRPCINGCDYCNEALDAVRSLKRFFGYDSYRTYGGEPLQEKAAKAAINNKSLLAVFPTGGGKSITFQVPALMAGENTRGLTVVISPLQSLMKDQVDNLERSGITESVTINGMLDPIERGKSFERVEDGSASLLYISPESLRSKTIERLLSGRKIVRFVIDEAHCFSSWGQDFRVDYLYIGDFIRKLQEKKNLSEPIPVSCFTATAKQKVIEDICQYFKEKLSLQLDVFRANASRTNLHYRVFDKRDEEEKYNKMRSLIESKNCPTIVYVSRTRKAYKLAERLRKDGLNARAYHGKMDVKEKSENQNAFIAGEIQVMVATSAFGMGVDKKDVGMVIHFEISDSLENYVQEAGRAGRDENISADCYVLFNEEDLSKHFILLNQTKLTIKEIQQIWRAIKEITRVRSTVSNSALEIARKAGWDDNVAEIETRVTTAIAALEQAGYLKRGQNQPRVFANSILSKNAQQAIDQINQSLNFSDKQKEKASRIIRKLFSAKSRKNANDEEPESRIDYISDHLGMVKEDVIRIITLMREEEILADTKDLTAFIKQGDNMNRSLAVVESYARIENNLLPVLEEQEQVINIKEINDSATEKGCTDVNPHKIRTILNFWSIKNFIKQHQQSFSNNHISVLCTQPKKNLKEKQQKRHELSKFIVNYLYLKSREIQLDPGFDAPEVLVEFSVHELKEEYENENRLFKLDATIEDIEDTLFYLSRIEAIKIEGGFLVVYNKLTIDRLEKNNKIQYKNGDYRQLEQFYESKVQQIHIVGEYANKMLEDYNKAIRFVDDYFKLNYTSFLNKYFPGSRKEDISRNITPGKFRQLFGTLSPRQLEIIKDNQTQNIVVAAGPGSGKTRVLVHKLASLLLMEDVKHEQLLMLTFSRAATTEFKKRLLELIGNAANFVEIKTFHSYCFDLLGRVGSLERTGTIIHDTIQQIRNGEVEPNRITKNVLVIDEAQDMDQDEFELVRALMEKNEEIRLVAVGDDDQNIYTFRGADSKYFEQFVKEKSAQKYELIENYRSKKNLVEFTNQFVEKIHQRFKETPIVPQQQDHGKIRLFQYRSKNLVTPLVNDILSVGLSGTTGVLTKTNDEALQITGLLLRNGIPAKLIQSNEGFNLYNLLEIRSFVDDLKMDNGIPIISNDTWKDAKRAFINRYKNSANYELCKAMIVDFQETNPKVKYKSDLETFIKESKLEDFSRNGNETIFISTIHKAKGKEFENVFLLLDDFDAGTDDKKRQLYVAMTRAQKNLTIHYNGNHFADIVADNMLYAQIKERFYAPEHLTLQLTHKDVNLGYFGYIQHRINSLISGHALGINNDGLTNSRGELVVKFSRQFLTRMKSLEDDGYQLKKAKVSFIVYWKNLDEDEEEVMVVLPELGLDNINIL